MLSFGKLLREIRLKAGLSQKALAEKIDFSVAHLNKIESGQRNPPKRHNVMAIAEALNLSDHETDRLLLSAEYAPFGILSRISRDNKTTSKSFAAPLSREDLRKLVDVEEGDKETKSKIFNRLVTLMEKIAEDPALCNSAKRRMEQQIYAFAEWTYINAKDRKTKRNRRNRQAVNDATKEVTL
jgi:transcriptional regulator with XRE-family HTH domain